MLLVQPLFSLYDGLYAFMSAVGCMRRIETFLSLEPRREARTFSHHSSSSGEHKENHVSSTCISVTKGTFGWSGDFRLNDINICIATGDVVFLVGPVASGKTTLLKAILGETPHFDGLVELATPEIAFCEQTPWLMVCVFEHADRHNTN